MGSLDGIIGWDHPTDLAALSIFGTHSDVSIFPQQNCVFWGVYSAGVFCGCILLVYSAGVLCLTAGCRTSCTVFDN